MNTTITSKQANETNDVVRFLESEKNAMEHYRIKANSAVDPALKQLFKKLSEERSHCYLALESYVADLNSNDILKQINEMFE